MSDHGQVIEGIGGRRSKVELNFPRDPRKIPNGYSIFAVRMYAPYQLTKTQTHGSIAVQAALYTVVPQTKARTPKDSVRPMSSPTPRIIHIFSLSNYESDFSQK